MYIHYIIIVTLFILGFIFNKNKFDKRVVLILSILFMFIFSTFRDVSVGNDTNEYVRVFNSFGGIDKLADNINSSRYELGYVLINTIIKTFTNNYTILLGIISIIYLYSIYHFINKHSKSKWISIFLFYTLGIYFLIFNLLRQCIAISIFLYAIDFIINKNPIKYIISIFIASLFHITALILIPIYLFANKRINLISILSIIMIILAMLFCFDQIMNILIKIFPQYSRYYISSKYAGTGVKLASIMQIMISLFILVFGELFYKKNNKLDRLEKMDVFENIQIFNLCILIISMKFNLLDRISDYFLMIQAVYLSNVLSNVDSTFYLKNTLVINISIIYITIIQYFRPEWSGIFPYIFKK